MNLKPLVQQCCQQPALFRFLSNNIPECVLIVGGYFLSALPELEAMSHGLSGYLNACRELSGMST